MSVVIKGMDEIPDDGAVLVVRHDNGKVYIKDAYTYGYSMEMVKLPEKHGELVDREYLREMIWNTCDTLEAVNCVDHAPTIIEAEGAES